MDIGLKGPRRAYADKILTAIDMDELIALDTHGGTAHACAHD